MRPSRLDTLIARRLGLASDSLTRATIESWQGERLARMVAFCRERSPYYRRTLAAAGIGTVRGLEDLPLLPFTDEATVRAHGLAMVCVGQDEVARIVTVPSSGTTGAPKRLCFTEHDLEQTLEFFHLGMQHLVDPDQTVAILLPSVTPDSTGHLLARALARMQVASLTPGLVHDPAAMARLLAANRSDTLVGFPVQILAVARMAAFLGLRLDGVRSVLLCSDYIPERLEECVGDLLGAEIFHHYGAVETGLGGGVDCQAHCGCHLRESDLLLEIVEPETGAGLPEGEWGEMVCTTLNRTGMPLIRYRTGDLGRLLPGPCACGSVVRRLDRVRGRISQIRTLASEARISLPELDEQLFSLPGLLDYSATLESNRGSETLRLALATLPGQGQATSIGVTAALTRLPALHGVGIQVECMPAITVQPGKRILHDHRKDSPP